MGKFYLHTIWVIFCFLPSCSLFHHDYHSIAVPLECTDLEENVNAAFASGSFVENDFIGREWWMFFGDSQLNTLIELGLECNPDIGLAEARIRLAAEKALLERSTLYPHVNFDPSIWRHRVGEFASIPPPELGVFTEASIKLIGTWDLDIWNRNRALYYSALDEIRAAWADEKEAELLLSTTIAGVYFDLQMQLILLGLMQEQLKTKKQVYALLDEQFNHGIIPSFRLYETDTEIAFLEELLLGVEKDIETDHHALAALVGNACCLPCADFATPSARFCEKFPLPQCLPLDLIARRPEITAQRWRIEGACYQIKAAKAAFYPNVNLFGHLALKGFRLTKLFQWRSLDILGDIAGHLPIFNAGELQAKLGVKREEFEIAIEEYNQLILNAVQEVSDWITALVTADQRQVVISRALCDAEELLRLTNDRFENGVADLLSVCEAELNVFRLKELQTAIQLARFQAAVGLIRSIGGGYYVE